MKQKYPISIADIQMTVVTEEPEDSVNALVKTVDRTIRETNIKNKRCSKTEAAVLCALEYCSENEKAKERLAKLEAQTALYISNINMLKKENENLKAELERQRGLRK